MEKPKSISYRSGCKVCWETYATEEEAKVASVLARKEGYEKAALGYDFGYCSPGSIDKVKDGWEGCWP